MKIKVSDLKDEKLAEWVARAQGWEWDDEWHGWKVNGKMVHYHFVNKYRPDINGGQAMELAEKYRIDITVYEHHVNASVTFPECKFGVFGKGKSHREAICRAVIASVYGEEVDGES